MTLSVNQLRAEAAAHANQQGLTAGNQIDAFRHIYSSAVIAQDFGMTAAHVAGDTIEWLRADNKERDRNMDLLNNEFGRALGIALREFDRQALVQEIARAVRDGRAVVDFRTDPRTLPENFPSRLLPTRGLPGAWDAEGWGAALSPIIGTAPDPLVQTVKWVPFVDPLVLDLDGDGLSITRLSKAPPTLFDANADGIRTATAWVGAGDGLLVLDRNANGLIDSGRELFGDETLLADGSRAAHGFAALAELDANGDAVFDAADARFADVRVWRDLDQDGVSDAGELFSLADKSIASISLNASSTSINLGNGNTVSATATVTRSNGSTTLAETVGVAARMWTARLSSSPRA